MKLLTGNNFKSICDFSFDEFGYNSIHQSVKRKVPLFFVKTDYIDDFFSLFKPEFDFILLTHNSDYHIDQKYEKYYNCENLVKWFGQNIDFHHPKLQSIPIGIANEKWAHGNTRILQKIINENNEKNNLIYSNFNVTTNPKERSHCINEIKKRNIVNSNRVDFERYLRDLSKSYFVISPNGNGVDCHKTWESLYLKTIPIVTESINSNFYSNLPIVIIKDWTELNLDFFTEENYHRIWNDFDITNLNIENFLFPNEIN